MSINTKMDTITVNDVEYDVERMEENGRGFKLTLGLDGEEVFESLEGWIGYEELIENVNPREWCNTSKMACSHPHYNLGDSDIDAKDLLDNEIDCDKCDGDGELLNPEFNADDHVKFDSYDIPQYILCEQCEGTGIKEIGIVEYIRKEYGARVIIPLFLYDHSGISMSAGTAIIERDEDSMDFSRRNRHPFDADGWDVSSVGVIFDTPEGVKETIGDNATDQQIEVCLRSEVAVYSSYLEGDVVYYSVTDDETDFHEACGGYVGDYELCEKECFASMEKAIVARLAEGDERAHWAARDTETQ